QSMSASDTASPTTSSPDATTPGSGNGGNGGGSTSASPQASAGNGGHGAPAAASFTDAPPVVPARLQGLDLGPACSQCGGMMQRTGSCYTCSSCGNNTGCG
ncbi:MAG: ribonucleoside-diphosphate reductase, adenosylcobalamin-dependent, partial [Solirubrobacterales bacterium]|nr:ribonucleoside-diphosphate reductase, adenosylcobalamin-dependent [Solirubrobacterales bacterium]